MNTSLKVRDMVRIALCSVIIIICSQIIIPAAVPFTMQTFAIFCTLEFLGGKKGSIAIALYIFLGMLGLPVFSGFSGGIGALLGPTGGYIIGFLPMGLIYWIICTSFGHGRVQRTAGLLAGLILCYIFGTFWFMNGYSAGTSFSAAFSMCVLPFIVFDLLKMFLGCIAADILKRNIR